MSAHVSWLLDAAVSRKEEQTSVQVGWNHFLQRSGDAFLRRLWWGLQIEASLLVRHPWFAGKRFTPTLLARHGEDHDSQCHCISAQGVVSCESWGWSTRTNHHSLMKKMIGSSWSITQGLVVVPFWVYYHSFHIRTIRLASDLGHARQTSWGKSCCWSTSLPSAGSRRAPRCCEWQGCRKVGLWWPVSQAQCARTHVCHQISQITELLYFHQDTSMILCLLLYVCHILNLVK